jgi:hypothetical protein
LVGDVGEGSEVENLLDVEDNRGVKGDGHGAGAGCQCLVPIVHYGVTHTMLLGGQRRRSLLDGTCRGTSEHREFRQVRTARVRNILRHV